MESMSHSSTFLLHAIPSAPMLERNLPSFTNKLVILNQPLPRFAPLLWDRAQTRVCADGGANRLYDEMPLLLPNEDAMNVRTRYVPDAIKGDMDSIRDEVRDFYDALGTKIIHESHDQDTTDLNKCVAHIRDCTSDVDKSSLRILVAGALGGRFDHEMGNIDVLCRFSDTRIILLSDYCLVHLLPSNYHHKIYIQSSVEGPHCGLIPIGMPSGRSTTTGLQWDLNGMEMKFGRKVSTSNRVTGVVVTVQSDSDLLWTISIQEP